MFLSSLCSLSLSVSVAVRVNASLSRKATQQGDWRACSLQFGVTHFPFLSIKQLNLSGFHHVAIVVDTAARQAARFGVRIQVRARDVRLVLKNAQTGSGVLCFVPSVKLTTHLYVLPRLRMSGAIPPGAHQRDAAGLQPSTNHSLKITDFTGTFSWFGLQPNSATEIGWWLVRWKFGK